ncbi:MAG: tRNA pseudouridine(38-40) synthase TruA [Candidatus Babeliales bacterium]
MNRYKFVVAYDGTDYFGWQEQKNKLSIVGELKKAFKYVFDKEISIVGASRTDAGVHALGQVALCRTDLAISVQQLQWAWNNVLPSSIVIKSLEQAKLLFHPFYRVEQKTYHYHFFLNRPLPFLSRYGWYYPYAIDHAILKQALNFFVGTHNFASFRNGEDTRENTIRTIDMINVTYLEHFNAFRIVIKGQKFLRHMIRRLVGASMAVASINHRASLAVLQEIMTAQNPNHFLPNAPARGLLLDNIIYNNQE